MLTRLWLYAVAVAFLAFPDLLLAAESSFFQGKTIRIVVGTSPGITAVPVTCVAARGRSASTIAVPVGAESAASTISFADRKADTTAPPLDDLLPKRRNCKGVVELLTRQTGRTRTKI